MYDRGKNITQQKSVKKMLKKNQKTKPDIKNDQPINI